MRTYKVIPRRSNLERMVSFKDKAETVKFDYGAWAEENGTVTAVTWTLKSGSAVISGTNLSANVATAVITTSEVGGSVIKVKATTGSNIDIAHLDVFTKDPDRIVNDYGFVYEG